MDFETLFMMGLDRHLPPLLTPPLWGHNVGLGEQPGGKKNFGDINLGLPDWRFPEQPIPLPNNSVSILHAYHFLEHLPGEDVILLLREAERVLMEGGILQFAIPWHGAEIAFQDLTHKSFWSESSFRMLFDNAHYSPTEGPWSLRVHYLVLSGIVGRNICLLGQIVKDTKNG